MTNELVRLSCNLNQETAAALKSIAASSGLSYTEVVRRAIGVYKFLIDENDSGRQVRTMDPDERNQREVILMR
jgi:hypothetical protein